MLRLHENDINTPEYFDRVWNLEKIHRYDTVRLNALCAPIKPGDAVVELGSGVFGFVEYALVVKNMPIKGVAVDFSNVALDRAKVNAPNLYCVNSDARHTPLLDGMFDVVGSGELIEHLEKPEELVAEMNRICKPNGFLVLSTLDPDCPDAIRHGDYPEHLWQFTKQELIDYFKIYGSVSYSLVGDYHVIVCKKYAYSGS